MTPDEAAAARHNAAFERALVSAAVIAATGVSVFMIVLLLISPWLALPLASITWLCGYLLYRYIIHALPALRVSWHLRRMHNLPMSGGAPHEVAPLTQQEQTALDDLEQVWRTV